MAMPKQVKMAPKISGTYFFIDIFLGCEKHSPASYPTGTAETS